MRWFFFLLIAGFASTIQAQGNFSDKLSKSSAGEGQVKVFQDAEIKRLVDGTVTNQNITTVQTTEETGTNAPVTVPVRKMKANGYRIQVYAGGNSRSAKHEAQVIGEKGKENFSQWAVYTHFQSPRWICRVGDFRTYEEASSALKELRDTKQFNEALIVKSVILIPY